MTTVDDVIRVVVIDDHAVFAESISTALAAFPDVEVVGVGHSRADAVALVGSAEPDAVLLDYRLADASGADVIRSLHEVVPELTIVVLTAAVDERTLAEAMDAGCSAYVTKDQSLDAVIGALRSAVAGRAVFPPDLLRAVLRRRTQRQVEWDLSPRELEVLALLAEGLTNKAIAARLVLSLHTVRNHVQNILGKLGAHTRLEAVAIATRAGLLPRRSD